MMIDGQMSLFDTPRGVGKYVRKHGAVICHIMRPGYIGREVVIDVSTQSQTVYQTGILERYIPYEGRWRAIVDIGQKQRQLITFYTGVEIYEKAKG